MWVWWKEIQRAIGLKQTINIYKKNTTTNISHYLYHFVIGYGDILCLREFCRTPLIVAQIFFSFFFIIFVGLSKSHHSQLINDLKLYIVTQLSKYIRKKIQESYKQQTVDLFVFMRFLRDTNYRLWFSMSACLLLLKS